MCCDLFEEIIYRLLSDKKIDSFPKVRLYFIFLMEVLVYSVWVQYSVVWACKNMSVKTYH